MAGQDLSKRALYYMTAQMAANVVGLVTGMVLARVFTKIEMGNYEQLMMVYTLFSSILIMGLPQSLTYFYAVSDEKHKAATVYLVTGLLFVLGIALGLSTYFAAPLMARYFRNDSLFLLIRNFFLFYAFTLGGAYIRRLAVVTNRYRFLMFWLPFDRAMMLVSFAVPALLGYGLATAVRVAVWVAGAKFAITTVYMLHLVPPSTFNWQSGLGRRMFVYAIPLGLSAAVGRISGQIDRLVVGRFMGPEFFAVFSLGTRPIPLVSEICESVMTVLIPVLAALYAEKNIRQFVTIWQEAIRKTAIIILAIFAFVEVFAQPCMVGLYGPGYAESALYFRLQQAGLVLRVTVYGSVLQAIGRTRQILYAMVVLVCVRPFISVGLFKAFDAASPGRGPIGLQVGGMVLATLMACYFIWVIKSGLGVSFRRVWPWAYHGKILLAAVLSGLAAAVVFFVPEKSIAAGLAGVSGALADKPSFVAAVQLLMGAAVFMPVYILALHVLRATKEKDWALFADMTYGRFVKKWRSTGRGKGDSRKGS